MLTELNGASSELQLSAPAAALISLRYSVDFGIRHPKMSSAQERELINLPVKFGNDPVRSFWVMIVHKQISLRMAMPICRLIIVFLKAYINFGSKSLHIS